MLKPRRTTLNVSVSESTHLFVDDTPIVLLLEGEISPRLQARFVSLFRSVWNRIPQKDQGWMLAKARKHKAGLRVSLSRSTHEQSCGTANSFTGKLWFDAWFIDAATDPHAKAIIAHELGHWRAYADPYWPDIPGGSADLYSDSYARSMNASEALACLYAERLWRFSHSDAVFKSQMCLRLDEVVREVGLKAQVFQSRLFDNGESEDTFLLLPKGKRLPFDAHLTLDRLGGSEDDIETMAAGIRSYIR